MICMIYLYDLSVWCMCMIYLYDLSVWCMCMMYVYDISVWSLSVWSIRMIYLYDLSVWSICMIYLYDLYLYDLSVWSIYMIYLYDLFPLDDQDPSRQIDSWSDLTYSSMLPFGEWYNLHDLAHVSWVASVPCRSCPTSRNGRWGARSSRSSSI